MYDSLEDAVGVVGAFFIVLFSILLIAAGLSWAGYAIDAHLSKSTGSYQQQIDNNSADNRTAAQANFTKLHSQIIADQFRIAQGQKQLALTPGDPYQTSVVAADQAACARDVGDYNAAAIATTLKDWIPAGYPASYDTAATCG